MPFLTEGWAVESTNHPQTYRLLRELVYQGRSETFTVPWGFLTDYASVPRLFTWLFARDGIHTRGAILHDWLCEESYAGRFSRRDADGIFRRVLREAGVDPVTRWSLWIAVRLGGMFRSLRVERRLKDPPRGLEWVQLITLALVLGVVLVVPLVVVGAVWILFRVTGLTVAFLGRILYDD